MSNLRAIGLVLTAMVFWSTQDVIVKFISDGVSLWQLQLVRSIGVIALIAIVLASLGRMREFFPSTWLWPLARGMLLSAAYLFFYAALPYVSLAKASSTFFISPLLITLFAALFLGEGIGPRRVIAVIVGFAGVLCIVQPGLDGWTPYALLPIGAALSYALAVILTRWRCQAEAGFSLTVFNNLINGVVGAAGLLILPLLAFPDAVRAEHGFVLDGWQEISAIMLVLMLATSITHVFGALASVRAYQIGEASRIAPFEYVYLVLMAGYGYAIWRTVPDAATLTGMALICGAGGFVAWREGRPPRPRVQQNAEIPWTPEHLDDAPSMPPDHEGAPSRNW